jgi:peptidoglycan/xylan/chitin deacetylase (PgdA/CDA1 family)
MKPVILVKELISTFLSSLGLQALLERIRLKDKAVVLMYHRVLNETSKLNGSLQPGMFVKSAIFDRQLSFLRKNFEVLLLDEIAKRLSDGKDIGRCCAVTFDDGWKDNYTVAFPILKKHAFPATIFLATGFIGVKRNFWPDELKCYLNEMALSPERLHYPKIAQDYFPIRGNKTHPISKESFHELCIEKLKKVAPEERNAILETLRELSAVTPPAAETISWDQARLMLESGIVRFGAHTVNHEILDQVSEERVIHEIRESKNHIEKELAYRVNSFSYPNGNFTAIVKKTLQDCGIGIGVTTQKGFFERTTDLLEIPRIGIHQDISRILPMFRSRILFNAF